MYLNLDSNFNNKKIVNFLLDDITLMTKKLLKANKLARIGKFESKHFFDQNKIRFIKQ